MSVAVWCNGPEVPTLVCADARLNNRDDISWLSCSSSTTSSRDQLYGQAGWDIGVNFRSLTDLASQLQTLKVPVAQGKTELRPIKRGEITKLAIHTHGVQGEVLVNGSGSPALTAKNVRQFHPLLHKIGLTTSDNPQSPTVILFAGCLAGAGPSGTELLISLSRVWPHRKVVGFASLGYAAGGEMKRPGEACTEPGMRDTGALFQGEADKLAGKHWGDLKAWPWATATSKTAKVALDGKIIFGSQW